MRSILARISAVAFSMAPAPAIMVRLAKPPMLYGVPRESPRSTDDLRGIEAEPRGGELGEGRLGPLPERRHAGVEGGAPRAVHADGDALVGAEARAGAGRGTPTTDSP